MEKQEEIHSLNKLEETVKKIISNFYEEHKYGWDFHRKDGRIYIPNKEIVMGLREMGYEKIHKGHLKWLLEEIGFERKKLMCRLVEEINKGISSQDGNYRMCNIFTEEVFKWLKTKKEIRTFKPQDKEDKGKRDFKFLIQRIRKRYKEGTLTYRNIENDLLYNGIYTYDKQWYNYPETWLENILKTTLFFELDGDKIIPTKKSLEWIKNKEIKTLDDYDKYKFSN